MLDIGKLILSGDDECPNNRFSSLLDIGKLIRRFSSDGVFLRFSSLLDIGKLIPGSKSLAEHNVLVHCWI